MTGSIHHRIEADDLDAFIQRLERLRAEGLSLNTLAARLGVPKSTIVARMARYKRSKGLPE